MHLFMDWEGPYERYFIPRVNFPNGWLFIPLVFPWYPHNIAMSDHHFFRIITNKITSCYCFISSLSSFPYQPPIRSYLCTYPLLLNQKNVSLRMYVIHKPTGCNYQYSTRKYDPLVQLRLGRNKYNRMETVN